MRTLLICSLLLAPAAAFAQTKADSAAAAPLARFIAAVEKGDVKAAAAEYAPTATIIDDFSPHIWQGKNAAEAWMKDFSDAGVKNGFSDFKAVLQKPIHIESDGKTAYVVTPAKLTLKAKGKPMSLSGTFTTVTVKTAAGWKISAWAWGGTPPM